jgi:carboxypeptidase T
MTIDPVYMRSNVIEILNERIVDLYKPFCSLIELPEESHERRTIHALRLRHPQANPKRAVLVTGGVHARELLTAQIVLWFAFAVCDANRTGKPLKVGAKTYPAETMRRIAHELEIFVVPLVNPDGREHVFDADPMWRHNRSPNAGMPCRGTDLNRNYDFLFKSGIGTSANSCDAVFKGSAAFSEPETRNVRHLLDTYPSIEYLMDVHSYSELILYPWGDDSNQSHDPQMNFRNPAYDGKRGNRTDPSYAEYMPPADENWFVATGAAVRDAIEAVRGRRYTLQSSVWLYPSSGMVKDYAYSRHFVQASRRKVYAYTLETGREFQPPKPEADNVGLESISGLVGFCERALTNPVVPPLRITGVDRGRTRILAVGGGDGTARWRMTAEDAIAAIRSRGQRFYVERPQGDRVDVVIGSSRGRDYLKTTADGDLPNNLLALPELP